MVPTDLSSLNLAELSPSEGKRKASSPIAGDMSHPIGKRNNVAQDEMDENIDALSPTRRYFTNGYTDLPSLPKDQGEPRYSYSETSDPRILRYYGETKIDIPAIAQVRPTSWSAPSMTTASTVSSEVQPSVDSEYESRCVDDNTPIYTYSMSHNDPYPYNNYHYEHVSQYEHDKKLLLGCNAYESQSPQLQPSISRFPEDYETPPAKYAGPFRRESRSPLRTGDDFTAGVSLSDSRESLLSTSEQNTESFEEDETHLSLNGKDSSSKTYPSFDLVRQALYDNSTKQFWNFYNGLSFSDFSILWLKHAAYNGAASSSGGAQKSASIASDTQTPSKIYSNATSSSLPPPKRKARDNEDEPNENQNPSKRPNRTSHQKERLNFACPFHKYKPWKYNHGLLRFRTCSTTPFDAIYRLKQHLYRVHSLPIYCTRCWASFVDQRSLVSHSQADTPCQRRQPVPAEGWTSEMDKSITKRKDETERERWERIYRELFGKTLTDVPSPYFVPYDLAAANEADMEMFLRQEVPSIALQRLSEQVNSMDIPDAARALFDPSSPLLQFESVIGNAIREVCSTYRSARAKANNPEAPPTPQPSSSNPSIVGDSSASSATRESMPVDPLQSSHRQRSNFESLPAEASTMLPEITRQRNDTVHPRATGGFSARTREQVPPPAVESAPQASETAPNPFSQNPPSQLQNAESYMQQSEYYDMASVDEAGMDEYAVDEFGLPLDFVMMGSF